MSAKARRPQVAGLLVLALAAAAAPGVAEPQDPPPPAATGGDLAAPEESRADTPAFDPAAATERYLARLSPEERARSDAYFEGGYWLQLWSFLIGLGIAWLLLEGRLSARLRDRVERMTRFKPLQTGLYAAAYIVLTTLLSFPLTVYAGYFREHRYGLSNLSFGAWLSDQGKGLALAIVGGSLLLTALYGVLRRAPRTWWLWGTAVALLFLAVVMVITPVFIAPLFVESTPLEDPAVREPILAMARAHGVPAEDVWVQHASRQTTRISANVSGLFGTERISLNDNLLERGSPAEIQAVMGHELGHYVLNHVTELLIEIGLVLAGGFAFLSWGFERARRRWGAKWGVRGIGDVAGLPLLAALLGVYFLAMSPVVNTVIRSNEIEADQFGLAAARRPDGFAEIALKLGEYRKLDPGTVEEWLFFDHPSGRSRIEMAMRFKAEHPQLRSEDGER